MTLSADQNMVTGERATQCVRIARPAGRSWRSSEGPILSGGGRQRFAVAVTDEAGLPGEAEETPAWRLYWAPPAPPHDSQRTGMGRATGARAGVSGHRSTQASTLEWALIWC